MYCYTADKIYVKENAGLYKISITAAGVRVEDFKLTTFHCIYVESNSEAESPYNLRRLLSLFVFLLSD